MNYAFDPEFGTATRRERFVAESNDIVERLTAVIGAPTDIVPIIDGGPGDVRRIAIDERELQFVRFLMNRGLATV